MSASSLPTAIVSAAAEAAGAFLRIDTPTEQPLLERLAASAIALGEAFLGVVLIVRDVTDVLAPSTAWRMLAAQPVTAIQSVSALPITGEPVALSVDGYAVDVDAEGRGWVRLTAPVAATRVGVGYTAGLATGWDDLPPPIAQGLVMLIAHLFDNRDTVAVPPAAVSALWRPWRRMRIGCGEGLR